MNEAVRYVSWEDYAAVDAVNWSTLKELRKSPRHYAYRKANPRPDVKSTVFGRAAHAAIFEPDVFRERFVVQPMPRRQGKAWGAYKAEQEGAHRTILTELQHANAVGVAASARAYGPLQPYLECGRGEYSIAWTDRQTGLYCKARPDWISDARFVDVLDVKTCESGEFRRFQAAMARYDYFGQGAFYTDGFALAAQLALVPGFVLVAIESEPPFDVALYRLDDEALAAGRAEYRDLLNRLAECRRRDEWPGRYTEEQTMSLPTWKLSDIPPVDEPEYPEPATEDV